MESELIEAGVVFVVGLVCSHFGIKIFPCKSTGIVSLIKNLINKK